MDQHAFEKVFEQYSEDARRVLLDKFNGNAALADDAVQDAAVYCLENLGRFEKITKSYFIQLAVSRAKNGLRREKRQHNRVTPVGSSQDLAQVEEIDAKFRVGRKYWPGDVEPSRPWTAAYPSEEGG
jgi:RNA polymerase sigma factor (sigma-70 family)